MEVGIGGRLDATNVVSPLATVITNIGLDHTLILGDTHARIAYEKAGIVKPGVPCVTAVDDPIALEVIERKARDEHAPLRRVVPASAQTLGSGIQWRTLSHAEANRPVFSVRTDHLDYDSLQCGLLGSFQQANAACAIGAVEDVAEARGFAVDREAVREGLAGTNLPGRMQIIRRRPTVLLDGAHNRLAAVALRDELKEMQYERLLLVVGMAAGHEPADVVGVLGPLATIVYATQPTWSRGITATEIAEAARVHCSEVHVVNPPHDAAQRALSDARPDDLVVVTGSFYVVGDVRPAALT